MSVGEKNIPRIRAAAFTMPRMSVHGIEHTPDSKLRETVLGHDDEAGWIGDIGGANAALTRIASGLVLGAPDTFAGKSGQRIGAVGGAVAVIVSRDIGVGGTTRHEAGIIGPRDAHVRIKRAFVGGSAVTAHAPGSTPGEDTGSLDREMVFVIGSIELHGHAELAEVRGTLGGACL